MNLGMVELVLYPEQYPDIDSIQWVCDKYATIKKYAIILHDKDIDKKPHYHVALHFGGRSHDTKVLEKQFNITSGQVQKIKGRWKDVLLYLTHANATDKYQYPYNDIVANFDVEEDIKKAQEKPMSEKQQVQMYVAKICNGEIRPYEFGDKIPKWIKIKHIQIFNEAWQDFIETEIKMQRLQGKSMDKKISTVFITGETGTGKTTLAKLYSEREGKHYCLTGSSNDPLQEYRGEEVLIFDDLRDDFKFHDFLKIIDPFNVSPSQSRYKNKFFMGDTIIITSAIPLERWYRGKELNDWDNEKREWSNLAKEINSGMGGEDLNQLYRRINEYINVTKDELVLKEWDDEKKNFIERGRKPNPVPEIVKNQEQQKAKVFNVL
jgi:hypothetical protein